MTLPDKLSDLIDLALVCLIKCERSPKYKIDMSKWHQAPPKGPCYVCLAGSVMAKELGYNIGRVVDWPSGYEKSKLLALDNVRKGNIKQALRGAFRTRTNIYNHERAQSYSKNPGKFKRNLRKLARDLRADGL